MNLGQPIGFPLPRLDGAAAAAAQRNGRPLLPVEPLDPARHAADLHAANR